MRFWINELAGWILIGLGLLIFFECYVMLRGSTPYYLQAVVLTFIGFVVFRGGIHLLKVAVAARICMQAEPRNRASLKNRRP